MLLIISTRLRNLVVFHRWSRPIYLNIRMASKNRIFTKGLLSAHLVKKVINPNAEWEEIVGRRPYVVHGTLEYIYDNIIFWLRGASEWYTWSIAKTRSLTLLTKYFALHSVIFMVWFKPSVLQYQSHTTHQKSKAK